MYYAYIICGHLGRDKTYQKIAERFFWKTLWGDVTKYIRHCETCQRTNDAKFHKSVAPLHPIPVKSKVWNQVNESLMLLKPHASMFWGISLFTSSLLLHLKYRPAKFLLCLHKVI